MFWYVPPHECLTHIANRALISFPSLKAISLALGHPENLDVLLMTATHGNIDVSACTKNIVTVIDMATRENERRQALGLPVSSFKKPVIAIGANRPILKSHGHGSIDPDDDMEGYHGVDGLNGFHSRVSDGIFVGKLSQLLILSYADRTQISLPKTSLIISMATRQ